MSYVSDRRKRERKNLISQLGIARANIEKMAGSGTEIFDTALPFADMYRTQRTPSTSELIAQFKGIAYACAMLNSQAVAKCAPRLYVQTGPGQKAPRSPHKMLSPIDAKWIRSQKNFRSGVEVSEILEHQMLDLLEKPNPEMSGFFLRELTQLYQEVTGVAYWRVIRGSLGEPIQIWPLPSQTVAPDIDKATGRIMGYKTGKAGIPLEDMIVFRFANLANPYTAAYGPMQAAWESVNLIGKDKSHQAAMLDNRARPDAIVSPKNEEAGMATSQATRLESMLRRKFRQGGTGGIMVSGTPLDLMPLTFSNADMEAIARYGVNKVEVLNQFMVPPALFESNKSRAELEDALTQHARNAVNPRNVRRDEVISTVLCPMFDPRLFVMSDDASPEDVERRVLGETSDLTTGKRTINEIRREHGQEEVDWGDAPWIQNTLVQPTPYDIATSEIGQEIMVQATSVLEGSQIAAASAIVTNVANGQIPRDAGIGQLVVLFNLTQEQAESIMGSAGAGFVGTPQAPPPIPASSSPAEEDEEDVDADAVRAVLRTLRRAGRELPIEDLAERCVLPVDITAQAVNRLHELGLVRHSNNGNGSGK